jgi:crotonobetainyl-CoA:carnitine CoA-transferase CaiB-like acyl-CoA transferase
VKRAGKDEEMGIQPLEGIRIIDLTVVWSGPGATTLLGDLGAEVIRVEAPNRQSRQVSARVTREQLGGAGYHARTYPGGEPGERPYDRSSVFNWHARNKLSVSMALDTPEGHEAFCRLVARSDVLVENNTVGVLGKLGIGHDVLLGINPRIIVARMPPLGLTGPMSSYLGYGPNFNSLVGIQAMDGYEGEDPTSAGDNYHMDEAAPAGLAFAVLAALWDRERTGCGQVIEFAQAENVLQEIGEYVLDHQMNGRVPEVFGNSDPQMLQDVFPTAEPDVWLALSIRDDTDWQALCAVVGRADWLADGHDAQQRSANAGRLKAAIAAWTATRLVDDVVTTLQKAGVPANEVMSESRLLQDPHLAAREWFQERTHPSVGTHRYPGHPWRAEGFDLAWGRPLPAFGEDNDYIYRDVLGYSDEEITALTEKGHITSRQTA